MRSELDGRVYAARRRSPECAATRRGCPGAAGRDINPSARLPDALTRSSSPFFSSTARCAKQAAAPHCRCELRQAPAHSPPRKRALHLHQSSAVIPSCSSSSPRGHSTSGEAAVGVPAPSHPRRRWRSPRPAHHRTTPPSLARVSSSPSCADARVMMSPPTPVQPSRTTAARRRAPWPSRRAPWPGYLEVGRVCG